MNLKRLLFLLTEYSEELNAVDIDFLNKVVEVLNKLQSDEEVQAATVPRGCD